MYQYRAHPIVGRDYMPLVEDKGREVQVWDFVSA